ncbi:MAG TPA: ABC transporter ATP-binding protein [Acidimicrobiales bacterium]|nr:ABC transporter ATP-binding protein [Acidimicrobiales bacterium]
MIEARGLTCAFGGRAAVSDLTFTINAGEVVAFLGPNGAGKTTALRLLLGLLPADAGTSEITRPVGYLPERYAAYDVLTVTGYLRLLARAKAVDDAAVDETIGRSGLKGLARRPVGRLSRGQRQKVGLAQATLGSPATLLLDEPTQGLDPSEVVVARRVVRESAQRGAAVLFSTHLLAEAASTCDRVLVIAGGRLVADEPVTDLATLEERFLRLVGAAALS